MRKAQGLSTARRRSVNMMGPSKRLEQLRDGGDVVEVVNIHEAKTQLSKLVERASRGERVIIARAGKPVAMLGPVRAAAPRKPGLLKGRVKMAGDFDAEMPAEWMEAFHSGHIEPE